MTDDRLYYYYERELAYVRLLGAEFAERYPKVAARLQLERTKADDPHVERLLEAFAFLAARVHLKIDDDFPEVSEALLNIVYPHYIRPLPPMTVVQFHLDEQQGKLADGLRVPREAALITRPYEGVPCRFRTGYETTLWPVSIAAAQWTTPDRLRIAAKATEAVAALRLELRAFPDMRFDKMALDTLRLHLSGDNTIVYALYELLANNCARILVRDPTPNSKKVLTLPADALRPVGFGADEGMLPYPGRSFVGYRLLQEYFTFPEKFLFFDLSGFDQVRAAGFGQSAEVVILIKPFERAERRQGLEVGVNERVFRTNCAPVINLFPHVSEPILLNQRKHEYLVVPDARRRATTQPFSVDDVVAVSPGSRDALQFEPFYSHRHGTDGTRRRVYWQAHRRPRQWRVDEATDIHLSFTDLSARTVYPDVDSVTVRLTCFNGHLPSLLPFGNEAGDFELEAGGPVRRIIALMRPTPTLQPPLGQPQLWRLISQLSLNYLSIVDGGTEALRELLRLHNFHKSEGGDRQIDGITAVRSSPTYERVVAEHGLTFARGRRVEMDFNEEHFAGAGVYLFASVLEHFLGMYASINSFTVLAARTNLRKGPLRVWAPRAGWKALL